jgi:hypothetical protein
LGALHRIFNEKRWDGLLLDGLGRRYLFSRRILENEPSSAVVAVTALLLNERVD